MKTRSTISMTAIAVVFAAGAAIAAPPDQPGHPAPAPGSKNDTMSALQDTAGHVVGTVSAEMTSTLKGFVGAAAISDMYEVEAARIAEQRSTNPAVKAFARHMIEAHTGTTRDLKAILAGLKNPPAAPVHLDDRRQGMIDELRGAKAADFDGRYISQQVDAHNEALILMRGYAKDGDNAEVKVFAAKTEKAVQDHLKMATQLQTDHDRKS